METKHKEFKPFDKVLVKRDWCPEWMCDIYSHYNEESEKLYHTTLTLREVKDENILPYEGNEELVGTTDKPEEEMRLEEGELIIATSYISRIEKGLGILERFKGVGVSRFNVEDYDSYSFAIRFKDFDPSNMEETKKHILCVKNGKIIRYKG